MDKNRKEQRRRSWTIFKEDVHYNIRSSSFKSKMVAFGKLLLLVLFLILVPIIMYLVGKDTLFNKEWLSNLPQLLEKNKITAFFILILMQVVQVMICILPGQPIQVASSYLYGVWGGYAISILGAILGSFIAFNLAKFLGNDAVHIIFGKKKVDEYQRKLNSSKSITLVLLIYLIPGIPKDLVAYVAGISEMKLLPFIIISTIGRSPGMLGSLLIGSFWQSRNYFGLIAVAVVACAIIYLCFRYRKQIMDFIDRIEAKHDSKLGENNGEE